MSWFRTSCVIFAGWGVLFFFFPGFTNENAGVGYVTSKHADDWTQIVGVFSLGFAVLLNEAHRSAGADVRRIVARGVLAFTLPCALLMTYWQIIPDRRWTRFDIANIALLFMISYGMFLHGRIWERGRLARARRESAGIPIRGQPSSEQRVLARKGRAGRDQGS